MFDKDQIRKCDTAEGVKDLFDVTLKQSYSGSILEGQNLLEAINIVNSSYRFKTNKNRDKREFYIQSGIAKRIEIHFSALFANQKCPSDIDLEILKYGLYGPRAEDNIRSIKSERFNKIIQDDVSASLRDESLSVYGLSKEHDIDRKTVRDTRNTQEYSDHCDLVKDTTKAIIDKSKLR